MTDTRPLLPPSSRCAGNAFVYILIAVALFAGLTLTLSNMNTQESVGVIDTGITAAGVNNILAYASTAQTTLEQMEMTGTQINSMVFLRPIDAGFNTAPHQNKVFHPQGGGLNFKPLPADTSMEDGAGIPAGYYIGRFNNFDWTPTAANDVIFVAYEITKSTCRELNRKITGSPTIPAITATPQLGQLLVDTFYHGSPNADMTTASCAACNGKPALCISTNTDTKYAFYNIIYAR